MMATKNANIGLLLASFFLVFLVSTTAGAATISVPGDHATIQAAINAAGSGDTVEVAAGTYSPGTNGEVFPINMKDGVALVGAGAGESILDANYTNRVIYCYNVGAGTKIQGFTITHGLKLGGWYGGESGAGILIEYGSGPTIDSCIIRDNGSWPYWGTPNGGGIRVYSSAPCITNCKIVDNQAVYGAGVYIYSTPAGEKVVIANCIITGNVGPGFGPGIYIYNNPTVTVVNTIAWGNTGGFYYGPPYDDVQMYWGTLSIHYNDTTYYVWYPSYSTVSASNNFYADPLFDGNYDLLPGSPCIGAGAGDVSPYTGDCLPCEGANMPDMGATTCEEEPSNNPPTANAGPDVTILSIEQASTVIQGTASDSDGDPIEYRWVEVVDSTEQELLAWSPVGGGGEAYLDLGALATPLPIGVHLLRLYVRDDGGLEHSDGMYLTIQNSPPVPNAGPNIEIFSMDQPTTVIEGSATDPDGDSMKYRWLEGINVLLDWSDVGAGGEAPLNLGTLGYLSIGDHTLTLEVYDVRDDSSSLTASDDMILTIDNSPPEVQPQPYTQTVELGVDPIVVSAMVADYDGDTVSYEWRKDGDVLDSGSVSTVQLGDPVAIPDLNIAAGDARFPLGTHSIVIEVSDGVNPSVFDTVWVTVQDSTAPTLSPVTCPFISILWPPNHKLRDITICANASDYSNDVTLTVDVVSSEPPDADADGNTIPDIVFDPVNDVSWDPETEGIINMQLRAERQGTGSGRIYTITITATDPSGNSSVAVLEIKAPHDKSKK